MRGHWCIALVMMASGVLAGETPYVGLRFDAVGAELAGHLGISGGARVRAVERGSPAEKAGFRVYDVLLAWGEQRIGGVEEAQKAVRASVIGSPVRVTVLRRGAEVSISVSPVRAERDAVSPPMKRILARVADVMEVTYYVSSKLPTAMVDLRGDTADYLAEVRSAAPAGRLRIRVVDPEEEARVTAAERQKRNKAAEDKARETGVEIEEGADDRQFDPFTGQMTIKKRTEYEKILDELAQKGVQRISSQEITKGKVEVAQFYSAVTISYRGKEDEVICDHRSLDGFEYELASRILKLTRPEDKRVVIAFFNGQPKPPKPPDPRMPFPAQPSGEGDEDYAGVTQVLGEVFKVQTTKLTESDPIPANAATLILAQPKDLDKRQAAEINKFVSSGGNLIVLAGNYSADLEKGRVMPVSTGLEELLDQWGIKGDPRPVNSTQCGQIKITRRRNVPGLGQVAVAEPVSLPTHLLATPNEFEKSSPFLRGIETIVCPWAMALAVDSPESLRKKRLEAQVLVRSDARTWFGTQPAMSVSDLIANGPARDEDLHDFKGAGAQNLVVLLRGTFLYAYEGKDLPAWPDKDVDAAGDAKNKPVQREKAGEKGHVAEPKGANVLVIGSGDFCKDIYYRQYEQRLYRDSYLFLRNVVEAFSLGDELQELNALQSTRGPSDAAPVKEPRSP